MAGPSTRFAQCESCGGNTHSLRTWHVPSSTRLAGSYTNASCKHNATLHYQPLLLVAITEDLAQDTTP
jgi:hypothetical protein